MAIARTQIGVKESGGQNRGPKVEEYLAAAGLPPGQSWCAAFIVWCYAQAQRELGMGSMAIKRTGKCARLWTASAPLWRSDRPSVGAIFIHLEDPTDPESSGHCGIVTAINDIAIEAIEGNTNAAGSRNGNIVREHPRPRSYVTGYIDIGRAGPLDLPRAIVA